MKKSILVFFTLLILSCANVNGEVPWGKILTEPSEDSFIAVKDQLSKAGKCDGDWYSNAKYSDQLFSLFNMVSEGNNYAFEISLLITDCLDGGNLGDMYRSMGLFFELKPSEFFRILDSRPVSNNNLKNMLVMLPLYTVDDIPQKIDLLDKRLKMASRFVENDVDPALYKKAVSILRKEINFYKSLDVK